jgi:hypothetical protein
MTVLWYDQDATIKALLDHVWLSTVDKGDRNPANEKPPLTLFSVFLHARMEI